MKYNNDDKREIQPSLPFHRPSLSPLPRLSPFRFSPSSSSIFFSPSPLPSQLLLFIVFYFLLFLVSPFSALFPHRPFLFSPLPRLSLFTCLGFSSPCVSFPLIRVTLSPWQPFIGKHNLHTLMSCSPAHDTTAGGGRMMLGKGAAMKRMRMKRKKANI